MINAKELCIGNIVSAKDARHDFSITYNYMEEVRYWKVVGLEDDWGITVVNADTKAGVSIANRSVRHQQGSYHFDPIPLTPELLESVGFVRNGGYGLILPGLRLHRLIPGDRKVDPWQFEMQDDFHKKIEYLHELQNFLFFAKGIELDINLDGPGGGQKTSNRFLVRPQQPQ